MLEQTTTEMLDLIESLRARWSAEDVPYGPAATEAELAEFESCYSVRLPEDLRMYFSHLGGMKDWSLDNSNFTFFPLRMVQSLPEFSGVEDGQFASSVIDDPDKTFVIVDFLISSHDYLIHMSTAGRIAPVVRYSSEFTNGFERYPESKEEVAPSFAAFLQLYLTNPDALL